MLTVAFVNQLILSNFYTRTEVALRIAVLYTGNILATALAGPIAAGIFELSGRNGIAGWVSPPSTLHNITANS